ncbi:ATP-dependent helicase [Kitasatospora purpeofusca]|uniref:ATP-dependent helicase n=1 Tax=Kitasatospora purpeofusca TaxID=67352 RepID=A0ABZ1TWL9_9ACTN|nr:ATP-dependent helicase [Kitasatospora purpeofusca]
MTPELTEDQRTLVEEVAESAFVTACPGAGKTRAVVARYLRRVDEEPRKGIALVSFTNAAVEEVRNRCVDRQDAMKAPHFVGTFDGFIARYLVAPLYRAVFEVSPRLVQSWNDIGLSSFRLPVKARVPDVELSWFDYDASGRAELRPERIPRKAGPELKGLLTGTRRAEAEHRAGAIHQGLLRVGTLTCDTSRRLARAWTEDPTMRAVIQPLIANRFAEIIVDEAQDCGEDELAILQFLLECGIQVLMLGDLDQSIYEFRRAVPERVKEFGAGLPQQLSLSDNFRSTPAICAINSSLRVSGQPDRASGRHAGSAVPIHVLGYRRTEDIAPQVLAVAVENGFSIGQTIILSHGGADALRAVGAAAADVVGSNRVAAVVDAGHKLRTGSDGNARIAALERVERYLIEAVAGSSLAELSLDAVLDANGIERRWLRDTAIRLCQSLEPWDKTASGFSAELRSRVVQLDWPPQLAVNCSHFRAPTTDAWEELLKAEAASGLLSSTIHGVKGQEFPAVALTLPARMRKDTTGRTVLDDWEFGFQTEARRVLYVGASRAQALLMLVVPAVQTERVTKLLSRDAVPYQV